MQLSSIRNTIVVMDSIFKFRVHQLNAGFTFVFALERKFTFNDYLSALSNNNMRSFEVFFVVILMLPVNFLICFIFFLIPGMVYVFDETIRLEVEI